MATLIFLLVCIAVIFALAMNRAPLKFWAAAVALATLVLQSGVLTGRQDYSFGILALLAWVPALALALLTFPEFRRRVLVQPVFRAIRRVLPRVSETETQALEAGTVGFDAELFSGRPNWNALRAVPPVRLTPEEQAFLDGPADQLCRMIDDWEIRHNEREIPERIWEFVKKHGFLGMLISKQHGGLGFSAQAQSLVLGKIASRSPDVVTIVMVPNSLGPGELIERYGTQHQKTYYLPRLARGDEIRASA